MFTLCWFTFPISWHTLTAKFDKHRQTTNGQKEIRIMTNDELQVAEIQETDPIAAVQVANEEVEVVAAMAEIVEVTADPDEAVSDEIEEIEVVAEAEGEEEDQD
jgi:hypothetical protein